MTTTYQLLPTLTRALGRRPACSAAVAAVARSRRGPAVRALATFHPSTPWTSPATTNAAAASATLTGPAVPSTSPRQHEYQVRQPGTVSKKLRVLDDATVQIIVQDLKSVDRNADGRIETAELKMLLQKHSAAFTNEEITEIGELFYAGKSGGSVPFDRFIEAIDRVLQRERGVAAAASAAHSNDFDDEIAKNPLGIGTCGNEFLFYKSHGNYTDKDLQIQLTHTPPENMRDRLALAAVKGVRWVFDTATGWNTSELTKPMILQRIIYLETIAAVPGMVAAIVRHFRSLRNMKRDGGMMAMFLDEANNERMHLLTFVKMQNPGSLFRAAVIAGQFGFGSLFLTAYIISPKFCHRFVGYVEEEACATYTKIIEKIEKAPDSNELAEWRTQVAPHIARAYWHLGETGTVLDLMYAVRADEAEHRDVNHLCTNHQDGEANPVSNTEEKLNTMLLRYVKEVMGQQDPFIPAGGSAGVGGVAHKSSTTVNHQ